MTYNILIVDDSLTTRLVIKKVINLTDINVKNIFEANNGKEGIDILTKNIVDLVFLDLNMPIMDGVETAKTIRQNDRYLKLPIIFITSNSSNKNIEELSKIGINSFIKKPFSPIVLKKTLENMG